MTVINLGIGGGAGYIPVFVGDTGSGGVQGLVPAPPAGSGPAGYVLKADGSWGAGGSGPAGWLLAGNSLSSTGSIGSTNAFSYNLIYNGSTKANVGSTGFVFSNILSLTNSSNTIALQIAGSGVTNSTYTLPVAPPGVNGYVLSSTTAGVMSWVVQSGGGGSGWNLTGTNSGGSLLLGTNTTSGFSIQQNSVPFITLSTGALSIATDPTVATFNMGVAGCDIAMVATNFNIEADGPRMDNSFGATSAVRIANSNATALTIGNTSCATTMSATTFTIDATGASTIHMTTSLDIDSPVLTVGNTSATSLTLGNAAANFQMAAASLTLTSQGNVDNVLNGGSYSVSVASGNVNLFTTAGDIVIHTGTTGYSISLDGFNSGALAILNLGNQYSSAINMGSAASTTTIDGTTLKSPNLPNTSKPNILYYDTTSKQISYALASSGSTGWALTGNGSLSSGDFLGTSDASQPLLFKTNNTIFLTVTSAQAATLALASISATVASTMSFTSTSGDATFQTNGGNLYLQSNAGGNVNISSNGSISETANLNYSVNATGGSITLDALSSVIINPGAVNLPNIPHASQANAVFFDVATGALSYDTAVVGSDWLTSGNGGLVGGVLGTTDAQPWDIVYDNNEYISLSGAGLILTAPLLTLEATASNITIAASSGQMILISAHINMNISPSADITTIGNVFSGNNTVLNSASISMPNLPNTSQSDVVFFDSSTGGLSYGAAPSGGSGWSLSGNTGSGNKLGTTSNNAWQMIANNTAFLDVSAAADLVFSAASWDLNTTGTLHIGGGGATDMQSGASVSLSAPAININSVVATNTTTIGHITVANDIVLNSISISMPNIPNSVEADVLFFNVATGAVSYGAGTVSADWHLAGNTGSGYKLGTLTTDSWEMISNDTVFLTISAAQDLSFTGNDYSINASGTLNMGSSGDTNLDSGGILGFSAATININVAPVTNVLHIGNPTTGNILYIDTADVQTSTALTITSAASAQWQVTGIWQLSTTGQIALQSINDDISLLAGAGTVQLNGDVVAATGTSTVTLQAPRININNDPSILETYIGNNVTDNIVYFNTPNLQFPNGVLMDCASSFEINATQIGFTSTDASTGMGFTSAGFFTLSVATASTWSFGDTFFCSSTNSYTIGSTADVVNITGATGLEIRAATGNLTINAQSNSLLIPSLGYNGFPTSNNHYLIWNETSGLVEFGFEVSGAYSYIQVTSTTQAVVKNFGYITANSSLITFTLPVGPAIGDVFEIVGNSAGGWVLNQNASQFIYFGNQQSTVGTGGGLVSTNPNDCVKLVCTQTNVFTVISPVGAPTVA